MTPIEVTEHPDCRAAREAVQLRLDEPLPADREAALRAHVNACDACRRFESQMQGMREALRSVPPCSLPAQVRQRIESGVAGEHRRPLKLARGGLPAWRRAAVAAVMMFAVCGTWWTIRPQQPEFSDAEIDRAAEDLELVLNLTGRALARVEHAAFQEVLAGRIVPAVERIAVPWSSAGPPRNHE